MPADTSRRNNPEQGPCLEDFPSRAIDKIRYGDTDRQGHVNNAVFSTFLETGRVEIIHGKVRHLIGSGRTFVIARLVLDYLAEVTWPGEVSIGTGIASMGRSSMKMEQALFQNGKCVARAESIAVLMDESTRRSTPLPEAAIACLSDYMTSPQKPDTKG